MDQSQFLSNIREKMKKGLEVVANDVATVRTGRANPGLIESIMISAYDGSTRMQLREMATISTEDARTLVITPYDATQIEAIQRGILAANIGLTPIVEGSILRLSVPLLTQERREEYIRLVKAKIEAGRVMIRQIRHETFSQIKRSYENDELNEDEREHLEKKVQESTDSVMAEVELLLKKKEEELRQI